MQEDPIDFINILICNTMKKEFLLSVICFIILVPAGFAHVWRVNNNTGISADFSTFSAAYSVAANNDTLYIEGSSNSYGNITLNKPLVIIGPGYFLEQNPQTQANQTTAKFGTITFSTSSNRSMISGLEISGNITVAVGDINITRCYIKNRTYLNGSSAFSNIFINANYISTGFPAKAIEGTSSVNNVVITNNVINGGGTPLVDLGTTYSGIFYNNVIVINGVNINNFFVANNIVEAGTFNQNNNVFYNNIGNGTQFPANNNNQQNVNMSNVFVSSGTYDGIYVLKPGSPAIGAGNDGTDCGIFGGASPYVLSGLPGIPAIYEITMPSTGTSLNGINVTVKAKTHN
jgi:hypothetical protein